MARDKVRISDVARVAGVSTATVSRALSSPDALSDTTRAAVMTAIRETGYRVNRAARNLRTQRTRTALILVPNLGNPFFSEILAGINETLAERDFAVLIVDSDNQRSKGLLADTLRDAQADGVISLDGAMTEQELALAAQTGESGCLVFACEWIAGTTFPSVRSDNRRGAELVVQHLHGLGHRKIGHVTGPKGNVLTKARRDGMLAERQRLGLDARSDWIIRGDFSIRSGFAAGKTLAAMKERPTAVFCASDLVAFGLIAALAEAGLSVPRNMSVVGFDDIDLAAYFTPGLTTVRQDRRRLGHRAARRLLEKLVAPMVRPDAHSDPVDMIDVTLVTRASTAAPAEV